MRSSNDQPPGPLRKALSSLIRAPAIVSLIWPAILIVGGWIAWDRWGAERMRREFVGIDPASIQISPPPRQIRSSIVETVYSDTGMQQVSLLDPDSTARIAAAFSMHPWVRQVTSVRKLPGGSIDVRVRYRRPVAMVRVRMPSSDEQVPYFFPVDGEGVLLPNYDFAARETEDFIHIEVPDAFTYRNLGTPFGDPRVEAAAALADVLSPHRESLSIQAIVWYPESRDGGVPQFEVRLADRGRFFWGSPPGREPAGEATPEMKLQYLRSPAARAGEDLRMAGRGGPYR
ncbi:MAG: hypothetical protein AAF958_14550 [Planctomycetota bacterium]